ncbi:pyruvate dehydrogenase complex dihydrolipoamide acetyltransferase [Lichtheimia ornata]|uniref:Dihydrolipoamide acetyltransferase component of pyruvate dehydrogenase complex n=1 Tax=Lichtheimia ornata TaxID=688661 RepID=A0AAD7V0J8_9FUNG|nr:pyruvate dehydrogenase complex dihydrolipoamide acetyltransferase [Lichtheimia ornata]KAJ8655995.1 pyruvate dehydrogenase complex dihydrolipoamide acetyltransferase [Lichtheimia ornata]
MSCARRQLLRATSNLRSTTIRVSSRVTPLLARQATNSARAFSSSSQSKFVALRAVGNSIASVNARHYSSKTYPEHQLIAMPALSPTMTQGGIGVWQKKVGDEVVPGDVLVEIETDKAQMDFECQEEGYLAKILADTGAKDFPVGTPIAVLVENESDIAAFEDFTVEQAAPAPAPAAEEKPAEAPKAEEPAAPKPAAAPKVEQPKPAAPAPVAAAPLPTAYAPQSASGDAFTDIPTTNMRRIIADRLTESKQTVPHYYVTTEINMDKITKLREVLNKAGDGSYKLSVNDFIIKASALSLKQVPEVNAAWQGDFIRQYNNADISIAVATPTGLLTPIVTGVEGRGLSDISNTVKDMAARARNGKLAPHEYQGGSFSISNLGMYGVKHFTAIINPPMACNLAIGATTQKVVPDATKEKGLAVRNVMEVSLSSDHRVVDGAVAATWLKAFKGFMENPLKMLL